MISKNAKRVRRKQNHPCKYGPIHSMISKRNGPSAEFFNYFDANFNPGWRYSPHEGPDAELDEFRDIMM
jgi:hypothetical protein